VALDRFAIAAGFRSRYEEELILLVTAAVTVSNRRSSAAPVAPRGSVGRRWD
jgi:hypothetical protein